MLERTLIPLQTDLSRYIPFTVLEAVLTALSDFMLEMNRCLDVYLKSLYWMFMKFCWRDVFFKCFKELVDLALGVHTMYLVDLVCIGVLVSLIVEGLIVGVCFYFNRFLNKQWDLVNACWNC